VSAQTLDNDYKFSDDAAYFNIKIAGIMHNVKNISLTDKNLSITSKLENINDSSTGFGFALGRDFYKDEAKMPLRAEIEFMLRGGGSNNVNADFNAQSFILNTYYDFRFLKSPIYPYLGIGAGFSFTSFDVPYMNNMKIKPTIATEIGLNIDLSKKMAAGIGARYVYYGNITVSDANYKATAKTLSGTEILASLKMFF
jgi:opacity protein-like surface antigen